MINAKRYKYPNLVAEMVKNGDSIMTLARDLNMNYQTLSTRLKGTKSFELPEVVYLINRYSKSLEYLFYSDSQSQAS